MTLEAQFYKEGNVIDHTPASALTGGQVIQLSLGLAAIAQNDIAASATDGVLISGIVAVRNTATAGNVGDNVWWDENGTAVDTATGACTTLASAGDFWIGTLAKALVATDLVAYVHLNKANPSLPAWVNRTHLNKTADYTVLDTDAGSVIHCDGSAEGDDIIIITMLATSPGFEVIIQNDGQDGESQLQIEVNGADKFCNPTALDDGDQLHNTLATSIRGDYVHLLATTNGWYVAEMRGTWADGGA